jgi:GntR family transcriptional regulator of vanillate catabolism
MAWASTLRVGRLPRPGTQYRKLCVPKLHHELAFDALQRRNPARAERLMREHAWIGLCFGRFISAVPLV